MSSQSFFDPGTIPEPAPAGGAKRAVAESSKTNAGLIILIIVLIFLFTVALPIILAAVAGFGIFGFVSSHLEEMDYLECRAKSSYIRVYYDDEGVNGFAKSGGYFRDNIEDVRYYLRSTKYPVEVGLREYGRKLIDASDGVAECTLDGEILAEPIIRTPDESDSGV